MELNNSNKETIEKDLQLKDNLDNNLDNKSNDSFKILNEEMIGIINNYMEEDFYELNDFLDKSLEEITYIIVIKIIYRFLNESMRNTIDEIVKNKENTEYDVRSEHPSSFVKRFMRKEFLKYSEEPFKENFKEDIIKFTEEITKEVIIKSLNEGFFVYNIINKNINKALSFLSVEENFLNKFSPYSPYNF